MLGLRVEKPATGCQVGLFSRRCVFATIGSSLSNPTGEKGSVVSSPSGVRGGDPANLGQKPILVYVEPKKRVWWQRFWFFWWTKSDVWTHSTPTAKFLFEFYFRLECRRFGRTGVGSAGPRVSLPWLCHCVILSLNMNTGIRIVKYSGTDIKLISCGFELKLKFLQCVWATKPFNIIC